MTRPFSCTMIEVDFSRNLKKLLCPVNCRNVLALHKCSNEYATVSSEAFSAGKYFISMLVYRCAQRFGGAVCSNLKITPRAYPFLTNFPSNTIFGRRELCTSVNCRHAGGPCFRHKKAVATCTQIDDED